jgi:hypothetical protein
VNAVSKRATVAMVVAVALAWTSAGRAEPDSALVGTWELDAEATREAEFQRARAQVPALLATFEAALAGIEAAVAKVPEDRRAAEREARQKVLLDGTGEWREVVLALARSREEATATAEKRIRALLDGAGAFRGAVSYGADGRYASRREQKGVIDVEVGTWTFEGSVITSTATRMNGVAVKGTPQRIAAVLEGDVLRATSPTGQTAVYRRSGAGPVDETLDPAWIDPCTLVTAQEVAAAVGRPIRRTVPSGDSPRCAFHVEGEVRTAIARVEVWRGTDRPERFRARMGDRAAIPDLGDQAFRDVDTLYVRKGEAVFSVWAVKDPVQRQEHAEAAQAIARAVLGRLP